MGGIDYQHIQKAKVQGRLRKKLAEKEQQQQEDKAEVAHPEAPPLPPPPPPLLPLQADFEPAEAFDGPRKGHVFRAGDKGMGYYRDDGGSDGGGSSSTSGGSVEDQRNETLKAAEEAMAAIQLEQERLEKKAGAQKSGKAIATEDMKEQASKVCGVGKVRVTTADGSADITPQEKARLNAAVGTGKAQNVRAWTNTEGQELVIDDSVVSREDGAKMALVFSGCKGCKYVISCCCAKVFLRGCVDTEVIITEEARVLTQTLEVEYCQRTMLRVRSRICTAQIEQCSGIIFDIAKREYMGNKTMLHKGKELRQDGMLIWAGCSDLRFRVGQEALVCDYALEASMDKTVHKERTQFKVHYNSLNKLISEKVTRLINGFPSTAREEEEFARRENAQLQEVAQRMGVAIRRKEDVIGARVKVNDPCSCGSGKKYKKCCLK